MTEPTEPDPFPVDEQGNKLAGPDLQTGPTEPDEEAILEELYGPADEDGIYRGPDLGVDDEEDEMELPDAADFAEDEHLLVTGD